MYLKFEDFPVTVMENMRGGKGTVYIRKAPHLMENMKMYAQITIPFGASIGWHAHTEDEEVITVISGEGELITKATPRSSPIIWFPSPKSRTSPISRTS